MPATRIIAHRSRMNICVVGAGAIGGWVAAKLAIGGQCVMALSSTGALKRIELRESGGSQLVELAHFDARREQGFWRALRPAVQRWDELITEFNERVARVS